MMGVETSAMRWAIELAARGLGTASPNPVVGCVVLDATGEVAGEGWHERPGTPHAEVHALRAAGTRARGGTAVVTLEPCNHFGRTPPCRQALLDAGIARVVYAVADPNKLAEGGAAALRAAGVDVEGGLLAAEAERVNEAWLTAIRRGRPLVTWMYATPRDGRPVAVDERSGLGTAALADAARLRATVDVVVDGTPEDVAVLLGDLHAQQVRSVLLVGAQAAPEAFLTAGLLDRTVTYTVQGARAAQPTGGTADPATNSPDDAREPPGFLLPGFEVQEAARLGHDLRTTTRRSRSS